MLRLAPVSFLPLRLPLREMLRLLEARLFPSMLKTLNMLPMWSPFQGMERPSSATLLRLSSADLLPQLTLLTTGQPSPRPQLWAGRPLLLCLPR